MEVRVSSYLSGDKNEWSPSAGCPSRLGSALLPWEEGLGEGQSCPTVRRGRVQASTVE